MSIRGCDLLAFEFDPVEVILTQRDAIVYALSVGYGVRPLDPAYLRHLVEGDLVVAPTMANVLAHPGPWLAAAGADWTGVVHAEQRLTVHAPLPVGERLVATTRCTAVADRGVGKGAFVTFERVLTTADGTTVAHVVQTDACRFDGGCGSAGTPPKPLLAVPERAPDVVSPFTTPIDAALLFRLNGDLNPLHVYPEVAREAGFDRPILHGLATLGFAGVGLSQGAELTSIAGRFRAPTYPGEVLDLEIWDADGGLQFRVRAPQRDVVPIDSGYAVVRSSELLDEVLDRGAQ